MIGKSGRVKLLAQDGLAHVVDCGESVRPNGSVVGVRFDVLFGGVSPSKRDGA